MRRERAALDRLAGTDQLARGVDLAEDIPEQDSTWTAIAVAVAHAPSLDEAAFTDAMAKAATLCPVSNTLRGNAKISIHAALAS